MSIASEPNAAGGLATRHNPPCCCRPPYGKTPIFGCLVYVTLDGYGVPALAGGNQGKEGFGTWEFTDVLLDAGIADFSDW